MVPISRISFAAALGVVLVAAGVGPVLAESNTGGEPLFERLGGISGIALVVDDFVDDFVTDPVILANPKTRERKTDAAVPGLKYHLTSIVCEASGGPCEYVGPTLREAHEELNVGEGEWERMGKLFAATLARHDVGEREQEELFAILGPTKDDIVVAAE